MKSTAMPLKRLLLVIIAIIALIALYLFQRFNYAAAFFPDTSANLQFIFNRTFRYFFNDLAVILLLWAIFQSKKLLKIAFILQLFGLVVILPVYFYFKLSFEGPTELSSPLLSFIHRIVVNPILMLLLIPGWYYQQRLAQTNNR